MSEALHCHDPFHCVGYLNKAVDKCHKRKVKQHEELRKQNICGSRISLHERRYSVYSNKKIKDEGILIRTFESVKVVKSDYLFITSEENAEIISLMGGKHKQILNFHF
ncbi:MAG: transposase [Prevotellaceae bacterium]|nr:transposase [Prevotellaceae bacterium]